MTSLDDIVKYMEMYGNNNDIRVLPVAAWPNNSKNKDGKYTATVGYIESPDPSLTGADDEYNMEESTNDSNWWFGYIGSFVDVTEVDGLQALNDQFNESTDSGRDNTYITRGDLGTMYISSAGDSYSDNKWTFWAYDNDEDGNHVRSSRCLTVITKDSRKHAQIKYSNASELLELKNKDNGCQYDTAFSFFDANKKANFWNGQMTLERMWTEEGKKNGNYNFYVDSSGTQCLIDVTGETDILPMIRNYNNEKFMIATKETDFYNDWWYYINNGKNKYYNGVLGISKGNSDSYVYFSPNFMWNCNTSIFSFFDYTFSTEFEIYLGRPISEGTLYSVDGDNTVTVSDSTRAETATQHIIDECASGGTRTLSDSETLSIPSGSVYFIPSGSSLVIEAGSALVVGRNSFLVCNGTIQNNGLILVQPGGLITYVDPESSTPSITGSGDLVVRDGGRVNMAVMNAGSIYAAGTIVNQSVTATSVGFAGGALYSYYRLTGNYFVKSASDIQKALMTGNTKYVKRLIAGFGTTGVGEKYEALPYEYYSNVPLLTQ